MLLKQILTFLYIFYVSAMKCGVWLRIFGSLVSLALLLLTTGYFVLMHRVESARSSPRATLQETKISFGKTYPRPKNDPLSFNATRLANLQGSAGEDKLDTRPEKSGHGVEKLEFSNFNLTEFEATWKQFKQNFDKQLMLNRTRLLPGNLALALLLKHMQDDVTKSGDVTQQQHDDIRKHVDKYRNKKQKQHKDEDSDEDD